MIDKTIENRATANTLNYCLAGFLRKINEAGQPAAKIEEQS